MLKRAIISFSVLVVFCLALAFLPGPGEDLVAYSESTITVDKDGQAAVSDEATFGITEFYRAQVGSNRLIDGAYYGYTYYIGNDPEKFSCVFVNLQSSDPFAVMYVPKSAAEFGLTASDDEAIATMEQMVHELDLVSASGGNTPEVDDLTYYVTDQTSYTVGDVAFRFGYEIGDGKYYVTVLDKDGSDITGVSNPHQIKVGYCSYGSIENKADISITGAATGFAAVVEFFANMDYRPLFVTLRTTVTAIVIIFILGLLAAWWILGLSRKLHNVFDTIFTIPMVLPPTVCGFLLLLALGKNTALGQFFMDIGFPLVFSWPATVIAAVVVAFPLMYRNALGAFEGLDRNMLDAARTLGWSEFKIFRKLMLPLSWSSIAAGTVLAFARALGEFGATLFLAGTYAGITETIPIAIYTEWMNGNGTVAIFWTIVIILFSFAVIFFINWWSGRATKYRVKEDTGL